MRLVVVTFCWCFSFGSSFTVHPSAASLLGCRRQRVVLEAKKKRRKRKKQAPTGSPVPTADATEDLVVEEDENVLSEDDIKRIKEIANYKFDPDAPITFADVDLPDERGSNDAFVLPDINDILKRRETEELVAAKKAEEAERNKVKRSDKAAYLKLLEQSPFADADESLFEEEAYGTVSALLGERARPFLGIPTGPLQVGHFVGALGIVLMAFIEYPGFPLTNLPTPIRDALQGGLATVYAINVVLAIFSVFKASERGQPIPLWFAKTLSVGGLALDQLSQLPTLEETAAAKSRKGRRRA